MIDRKHPPTIYSPQEFHYHLKPISAEVLDNGIPFYSLTDSIEPVLQLEMVFNAGLWFESKKAIAQATAALFKSGTSKLNSFQINETFEQYGASVKVNSGPDWASVTVSCLTRHLSKILP
jgi:zinc protease